MMCQTSPAPSAVIPRIYRCPCLHGFSNPHDGPYALHRAPFIRIDGVMAGYVLLTREQGLRKLEEAKARTKVAWNVEGREVELPFSETYAVMRTLRFFRIRSDVNVISSSLWEGREE